MKCKHEIIEFVEFTEAVTKMIIEDEELTCNQTFGDIYKRHFECVTCGKTWGINKNLPKFLRKRLMEIKKLRGDEDFL